VKPIFRKRRALVQSETVQALIAEELPIVRALGKTIKGDRPKWKRGKK
jgi:hypothetical protein